MRRLLTDDTHLCCNVDVTVVGRVWNYRNWREYLLLVISDTSCLRLERLQRSEKKAVCYTQRINIIHRSYEYRQETIEND